MLRLVKVNINILVLVLTRDKSWGLISSSDLEHRVRVGLLSFTLLAVIKVWADAALVSDSLNRVSLAAITSN